MAITYGLTPTGLVIKTLPIIRDGMNADYNEKFGASVNTGDDSIEGQAMGIVAERIAECWEVLEQINSSQDPDKATGAGLDAISALTGTFRQPASFSAVTLTLTGAPTTVIPVGSRAATVSTNKEFTLTLSSTILALTAWTGATDYALGDRVTHAGNAYVCITAGHSAASPGPSTTSPDISDGTGLTTVHWRFMGVGVGAVDMVAIASDLGAVTAVSGDITKISNPTSGWTGVINLLDAAKGFGVGSDPGLRILREQELSDGGKSPIPAIRAALLKVLDVTAVTVFYNNTDHTDSNGITPHTVACMVRGGDDTAILAALFANVAAGITTLSIGSNAVTGDVVDSQGRHHTFNFARPQEVPIYVTVTLTKDPDIYPSDGDTQVMAAITAWGALQHTGKDAVASALIAQCFQVDGVLDASVAIGLVPSPTLPTTIPISLFQLATYDTSRIVLVDSDGTP